MTKPDTGAVDMVARILREPIAKAPVSEQFTIADGGNTETLDWYGSRVGSDTLVVGYRVRCKEPRKVRIWVDGRKLVDARVIGSGKHVAVKPYVALAGGSLKLSIDGDGVVELLGFKLLRQWVPAARKAIAAAKKS